MANERIKISLLASTVLPSRDHLIPSSKDGNTFKLTVAQILSLLETDDLPVMTNNLAFSADLKGLLLSSGGRLYDQAAVRTIIQANNGKLEVLNEAGSVSLLLVDEASANPLFKTFALWHDGNPNMSGMLAAFARDTAPAGWLKANGALLDVATYANLATAIYCGNTANPTAEWGYRTNSGDTVRSTTGTHIRLPDFRGEFIRGWDDARGIDSGRSLWAAQAQAIQSHTHSVSDPTHVHNNVGGGSAVGTGTIAAGQVANSYVLAGQVPAATGITIPSSGGGAETRPRNQAALICIKY